MAPSSKKRLTLTLAASMLNLAWASLATAADPATARKFDFSATSPAGTTHVAPNELYSKDKAYGFEPSSAAGISATDTGVTCAHPFFFSADLPQGNYKVTVTLGNAKTASTTTVKAELRRLMLENVDVAAGKTETRAFVVNIRTPAIAGGGNVSLKARETAQEAWGWDNRLTLEFDGNQPSVHSIAIEPVNVPTVYLLGDSTVCDQSLEPFCSWGQMLPRFFKTDVAVSNQAESGESVASSIGSRRFAKVLGDLKAGDFVLIQYGHNDMKDKSANAAQKFTDSLVKFVADVRARKGTVVLITPMNRNSFNGDTVTNTLADYCDAMKAAARNSQAPLIDLNAMSKVLYESAGAKGTCRIFAHNADMSEKNSTNHSPYGAYELAKCVITGLRRLDVPLAKSVVDDLPPFDPAKPDAEKDFKVPPSPNRTP